MSQSIPNPGFHAAVRARLRKGFRRGLRLYEIHAENRRLAREGPVGVEPQTRFPCYRSMDAFMDLDHLRSLHDGLVTCIQDSLEDGESPLFHTGEMKRGILEPSQPGSRVIELSVSTREEGKFNYFDVDAPDQWELAPQAQRFAPLLEFIDTLPFERTARMVILCDPMGRAVTAHRDHCHTDVLNEFIWFQTRVEKPLYMENPRTKERLQVSSHSAWFDSVNQFHGVAATGKPTFSVRVDGRFDDSVRARLPDAPGNRASVPALWASLEG